MPVAGTKCCMAGFGNCGHSGAEADSVQPKNSVAQLIQFNTGFNIVKDGFCIAEERPGNILLHTGVNDRGVWINEFTHIIARTGPIQVLNSTKTRSKEQTSKLQSLMRISYAVFCLKKKNKNKLPMTYTT